jgi:hypothetical protein
MYQVCVMRAGMIHGLGLFLLVFFGATKALRHEERQMITEEKDFRGFDSSSDIVDIDLETIEWHRVDKSFEGGTIVMMTPRYDRGRAMFGITDFQKDITQRH